MLSKIRIYSIHKEKNVFGNMFKINILVFRNMKLCVWYVCYLKKRLPPILFWFDYTSKEDTTHNGPTSHTTQHPPLCSLASVSHLYLTFHFSLCNTKPTSSIPICRFRSKSESNHLFPKFTRSWGTTHAATRLAHCVLFPHLHRYRRQLKAGLQLPSNLLQMGP